MNRDVYESFLTPSDEFTPIPFWFWNDELSEDEIERQMKEMKSKGVCGFVIHPRKGLPRSIEYLSDRYFSYVRFAVQKANEMDMKVVLYDEAMYPSGSCHGEVVKADPEFASKGLLMKEDGSFCMVPSGGTIRGVHEDEDDGEELAPKSADLLNPNAVDKFIELTHEKYYKELSEYFGSTIIAFFTDEPNILGRCSREDVIPWSEGIMDEFIAAGGKEENLKYLFESGEDNKNNGSHNSDFERKKTYTKYKEVIHKRLSESYYKKLSDWCDSHHIALTGHPEKSTDIGYLKFFQMPCQDIVWRFVEPEDGHAIEGEHSTMGKCSSDSARHRGKRRNGNECFGCCGQRQDPFLFTEKDMRWYLNWLFVRGVNLVYPHAFYYSGRGDRLNERPPEVGMHNPYWPEYSKMSSFIKRMCYLNTDSTNLAQVAVLCSADILSWKLAKPLFTNQIEFNYLEKELLTDCTVMAGTDGGEGKVVLQIASQKYRVLIADKKELGNLPDSMKNVIDEFTAKGGKLIELDESSFDEKKYLEEVLSGTDLWIRFEGDTYDLRFTHQVKEGQEYFFISNEAMKPISVKIMLSDYKIKSIVNPYTCQEINNLDGIINIDPCDMWIAFIE